MNINGPSRSQGKGGVFVIIHHDKETALAVRTPHPGGRQASLLLIPHALSVVSGVHGGIGDGGFA